MFSKWLFSTNKFLYVNTTQNVYEHVKKINFVACGLFVCGFRVSIVRHFRRPRVNSGHGEWTSGRVRGAIAAIPRVSEKNAVCVVHFAIRFVLLPTSPVRLEFKFMDFKF